MNAAHHAHNIRSAPSVDEVRTMGLDQLRAIDDSTLSYSACRAKSQRVALLESAKPGDFFRRPSGAWMWLDADLCEQSPIDADVTDRETGRRGYIIRVVRGSRVLVGWRDDRGLVCDQETVDASTLRADV